HQVAQVDRSNRLNDSRLPKQATAAHFKLVDNAQARIRRYLGYIFSSLLGSVDRGRHGGVNLSWPSDNKTRCGWAKRTSSPYRLICLVGSSSNLRTACPTARDGER